jgi:hypothetical protein
MHVLSLVFILLEFARIKLVTLSQMLFKNGVTGDQHSDVRLAPILEFS